MSWFQDVTGHTDATQEAWRDNFNNGQAAGDWTGNINASLSDGGGTGHGGYGSGGGGGSAGPGAARAVSGSYGGTGPGVGWVAGPNAVPLGPGSPVAVGSLEPVLNPANTPFMLGGSLMMPDPGTSNAEEVEERWGEAEFLSPAWFANWAVVGHDVWHNAVELVPQQTQFQPGGGAWITQGVGDWWQQATSPFGPDHPIAGFNSGGF